MPTLANWLSKAKGGEIAVIDDLNVPPLSPEQEKQFKILFQKENSAVIKKEWGE
ncbi:MAG: hypothetical protein HY920_02160 [Elusimicrobia bacterium]|nr:hypothetical protein [Elusimicrobiota bacterium]